MFRTIHLHTGVVQDDLRLGKSASQLIALLHLQVVNLLVKGKIACPQFFKTSTPRVLTSYTETCQVGFAGSA